ncbi:hypothetical protein HMPREF1981_02866 [Bacteroides pyogenes F0041]|uniref:Uncharacterized protein n=1 Tax=Bacteroides pyogenes F0041 TaxID=1321819 RepID=U2CBF3_9BACE|nr:hypothetical protein HMPREF1981_02866 [Bacteroides pyogenes F0041]
MLAVCGKGDSGVVRSILEAADSIFGIAEKVRNGNVKSSFPAVNVMLAACCGSDDCMV